MSYIICFKHHWYRIHFFIYISLGSGHTGFHFYRALELLELDVCCDVYVVGGGVPSVQAAVLHVPALQLAQRRRHYCMIASRARTEQTTLLHFRWHGASVEDPYQNWISIQQLFGSASTQLKIGWIRGKWCKTKDYNSRFRDWFNWQKNFTIPIISSFEKKFLYKYFLLKMFF